MPTISARTEGVAYLTETAASGHRPDADDASAGSTADAAESFDEWVAARGPSLLHFAHLITGSRADAQDAVQDALVAAYPRWSRLRAAGTQDAYVRRSIVNRHISVWRSLRRREQPVAEPDSLTATPARADHASAVADADIAWSLCQSLPRVQRAAVVLRYYDDQAYAQIADILGCTESTARSHVRRALMALRSRLDGGEQ
jgi:RNA polymerase sigma-70 factor (sigma-E family)